MPTPSPNPPPGPSSPPPYAFSTCPDDLQQPSHSNRQAHIASQPPQFRDGQVQSGSSLDNPLSRPPNPLVASGDDNVSSNTLVVGSGASVESSSRATTVSLGPRPSIIGVTFAASNGREGDLAKSHGAGPDGPLSHSGRVSMSRLRRPPGGTSISANPNFDTPDSALYEDDGDQYASLSMGSDFPSLRVRRNADSHATSGGELANTCQAIPTSSCSYLRPGSKFHGTQQSERQVYDVQVEIKYVDMRESFLCGYLRIQGRSSPSPPPCTRAYIVSTIGLTEDHPTLTTFFEGEIIGSKYGFETQHDDWGATIKTDMSHWNKFSAFRPLSKQVHKGRVILPDLGQRDFIFMRWKEHFLVPDHRVRTITGASFEGFYYICFNQLRGEVSGIYFHSKSEKYVLPPRASPIFRNLQETPRFQQLELKHVPNRGCFSAAEFR